MSLLANEYKSAYISGIALDFVILFFAAIITDGGTTGAILSIAVFGSLYLKALIPIRRPKNPTKTDLIWIRSASAFLLPVSIGFSAYFYR